MSDEPPSYEDSNTQHSYQSQSTPSDFNPNAPGNSQSYSQPNYQQGYSQYPAGQGQAQAQAPGYQGYSDYPDEKKQGPPGGYGPPPGPPDQNGPGPNGYDPMQDPNVYKVPPQLVNITQANPQHLNPSYPEFQQREQQRWAQGDYPKQYKHGAPLAKGKTNPNNKFGGGAFPGSGGATYGNAARK